MNDGLHVLVKFEGLYLTPYNIVTTEHWNIYTQGVNGRNRSVSWQEVARGTSEEMVALARLMPDPKTLNFD